MEKSQVKQETGETTVSVQNDESVEIYIEADGRRPGTMVFLD